MLPGDIKVCHLTSVHQPNDIRIFNKMCRSLVDFGFQVHLVALGANTELRDGVQIWGVPFKKQGRLARMYFGSKAVYLKALQVDADLYHIHDPELLIWATKLQAKGKKVVYDSHEDVPKDILDKAWIRHPLLRKIISSIFNNYEKGKARKLSGVISVLESITTKFQHPHAITIFNFPRLEFFDETPFQFESKWTGKFKLVYNGGLSRLRGIHHMVKAMEHLNQQFVLILMGTWESEAFKSECEGLPGWNTVVDLGFLQPRECMKVLKACDLGLVLLTPVSNYLNSLPTKVFEYMAAGIPTLMSDFEFWRKEFGSYARFVNPEIPQHIAAEIMNMKSEYPRLKQLAQEEAARILATKTWEHEAEKLKSFYLEILQSH
jgi:glycosyltransferase involved in cell wall biosynthesis